MVVLDHADLGPVSGGYVGVDIFFVVSGFVITGSLLGKEHRGGISLPAFYAARARRILPVATVVLVATVLASYFLLNFIRAGRVVTDAVWAGLFAANIRFSTIGTDYFSADLPPSPLQHYWSLAVEEQFYVVWPLLLGLLLFGVGRRRGGHAAPRPMHLGRVALALSLVIAVSLLWSIRQTATAPTEAFFSPFTRAWELAIGALLMIGATTVARTPMAARVALSWVGLAGAVASGLLFSASTPFPGSAALLPVLATAAIIAGGTGKSRGGAGRLLALPPLQAVGNWSFSVYLWHWPILIIAAGYAGHDLRLRHRLGLVVIALVLSFVSYHLIETPFRQAKRLKASRTMSLALWPVAVAVLLVTCLVAGASLGPPGANSAGQANNPAATKVPQSADPSVAVQLAVAAALANKPIPARLSPPIDKVAADFAGGVTGGGSCYAPATGARTGKVCKYGDVTATRSIVLIGDSHAQMWLPAVDAIGKKYGWLVYPLLKKRCTSAKVTIWRADTGLNRECNAWREWAFTTALKLEPQRVLIANTFDYQYLADESGKPLREPQDVTPLWLAGMAATIEALAAGGAQVTVFTDAPMLRENPQECLLRNKATMKTCTWPLDTTRLGRRLARDGAARNGASLLDVEPWFCASNRCPLVISAMVAYRDTSHVSRTYATYLSEVMARKLRLTSGG